MSSWNILGFTKATYHYDANGTRTRAIYQWPRQSTAGNNQLDRTFSHAQTPRSNRLHQLSQNQHIEGQSSNSQKTFQWDAAGQLLSDGQTQHHYDARGRKSSSQAPDANGANQTTHYLYNSASQRVRKASPLGIPTTTTAPQNSHSTTGPWASTNRAHQTPPPKSSTCPPPKAPCPSLQKSTASSTPLKPTICTPQGA